MFKDLDKLRLQSYQSKLKADRKNAEQNKATLSREIRYTIVSKPNANWWIVPHDLFLKGFQHTEQYQEIVKELAEEGYDADLNCIVPGVRILSPNHPSNRLQSQQTINQQTPSVTKLGFYTANAVNPAPQTMNSEQQNLLKKA